MWRVAAVGVLAGCGRIGFDPRGDAPIIGDGVLPSTCAHDPLLAACYAFDGDVVDGSGNGNNGVAVRCGSGTSCSPMRRSARRPAPASRGRAT